MFLVTCALRVGFIIVTGYNNVLHAATWLSKHAVKNTDLPGKFSLCYTDCLSVSSQHSANINLYYF